MYEQTKNKVMVIDRTKTPGSDNPNIQGLEVVNSFVYLGTTITDGRSSMEKIERRATIAKTTISKLTKI